MSVIVSGNALTFVGTGDRITGDFSNATPANRVNFQTSTTNDVTSVDFIPNGTGTLAQIVTWNNSNTTNAAFTALGCTSAVAAITAGISGTGTYVPFTILTGGSERLRIATSGNCGIGTSSPTQKLVVSNGGAAGVEINPTTGNIFTFNRSTTVYTDMVVTSNNTIFQTGGTTERMRIDSSGDVFVAKTTTSLGTNGIELLSTGTVIATSVNDAGQFYRKTATVGNGVILTYSDVGGTQTLVGAGFANGTFGVVSDINKKKNVEDARSYLEDLMKIRVVKYNWKTDEDSAPKELGWIAQEVEEVFPGMISEMQGSKLLKKEVFLPMMLKAIQEQQAMIEQLTARLNALEGK